MRPIIARPAPAHGVTTDRELRTRDVVRFWSPLAATWLMMSFEGPYIAAIIARLPRAEVNLAAYGVAFSLAWLGESPIMMLLTASNRLVHDRAAFHAVRRFMYTLNAVLTALMALATLPPVFRLLAHGVLELPPEVTDRLHPAMIALIPWPAAIGYRRFYQGILVRNRHPRRVAYGTIIRLLTMSAVAATLAITTSASGVLVGATALASGVVAEAVASRWMARHLVAGLLAGTIVDAPHVSPAGETALSQSAILRFYYPLALTSMIAMITGPMLTFFLGRGRSPIESLAVLPVVQNLVFMFRGGGVAYQEVGVALTGRQHEHAREVGRAALLLGAASSGLLGLLLFTPLSGVWFRTVAGLSIPLADFALLPARLLVILPATEYLLALQRSRFIVDGRTRIVTTAMAVEMTGLALVLWWSIERLGVAGAVAASLALLGGRVAANALLFAVNGVRPAQAGMFAK